MILGCPLTQWSCSGHNTSGQDTNFAYIQMKLAHRRRRHPSRLRLLESLVENFRARCIVPLYENVANLQGSEIAYHLPEDSFLSRAAHGLLAELFV